jgi:hypothetical protein
MCDWTIKKERMIDQFFSNKVMDPLFHEDFGG